MSNRFHGKEALALYRQRWGIEQVFSHFKKRGFDLETTHMSEPGKIEKHLIRPEDSNLLFIQIGDLDTNISMGIMEKLSEEKSKRFDKFVWIVVVAFGVVNHSVCEADGRAGDSILTYLGDKGVYYKASGVFEHEEQYVDERVPAEMRKEEAASSVSVEFWSKGIMFRCDMVMVNGLGSERVNMRIGFDGKEWYCFEKPSNRLSVSTRRETLERTDYFVVTYNEVLFLPFSFNLQNSIDRKGWYTPYMRDLDGVLRDLQLIKSRIAEGGPKAGSSVVFASSDLEGFTWDLEFDGIHLYPSNTAIKLNGVQFLEHSVMNWGSVEGSQVSLPSAIRLSFFDQGVPASSVEFTVKEISVGRLSERVFRVPYDEAESIRDVDADATFEVD